MLIKTSNTYSESFLAKSVLPNKKRAKQSFAPFEKYVQLTLFLQCLAGNMAEERKQINST